MKQELLKDNGAHPAPTKPTGLFHERKPFRNSTKDTKSTTAHTGRNHYVNMHDKGIQCSFMTGMKVHYVVQIHVVTVTATKNHIFSFNPIHKF